MSTEPAIPVAQIGPAAAEALLEGRRGRVLAAFRRSFYVQMEDGDVPGGGMACLGPATLGAGALNVLCGRRDGAGWPMPSPGDAVTVADDVLRVGAMLRFALAGARRWTPPPVDAVSPIVRAEGLALLGAVCAQVTRPRGLARLVLPGTQPAPGDASLLDALLQQQAQAALDALARWIGNEGSTDSASAWSSNVVPEEPLALLGLGEGLTPAGDDLLGGALIALHALGDHGAAHRLGAAIMGRAPECTDAISVAHLAAAAEGMGSAALHHVLSALSRLNRSALERALRELDAIGHTSGWDALAGAVAVWAADVPVLGHREGVGTAIVPAPEAPECRP